MAASRSAEARARLADWAARSGLPLPGPGDWQAADGWLAAGLGLLAGGLAAAVLSVWTRVAPGTRPIPDRLLPLAVALALLDGAVAGAATLRPAREVAAWRALTVVAVALGAVGCDPAGNHARLWIPWLVTAALLGLAMRAAETIAATLVDVLRSLPRGDPLRGRGPKVDWATAHTAHMASPDADLDRVAGENPLWTTWRVVAETWLLAAACAAIGGPGPGFRAAAAAAGFGGALLVAGAQIAVLRASWSARKFTVDARHLRTHWGLALAVAAGLVGIALAVPLPDGVAPIVRRLGVGGVGLLPPVPSGTVQAHSGVRPPHVPLAGGPQVIGLLLAVLHFLVAEFIGAILALTAAIPVLLPAVAALALVALLAMRFPRQTQAILRRLAALFASLLAFWRWIRLPARMRAALRFLGLERPETGPAAEAAAGTMLNRVSALLNPRAAVRAAYRRFLRDMAAAGTARPAHATPRAYADALPQAPAEIADLTTAYEWARFSDHAPERRWLQMARRGLAAVARLARRQPKGGWQRPGDR